MLKVLFTANPKIPRDKVNEWKDYVKDSVHEMSNDEALRWLRRGNAEIITTRQMNVMAKEEKEIEIKTPSPPPPASTLTTKAHEEFTSLSNTGTISTIGTLTAGTHIIGVSTPASKK